MSYRQILSPSSGKGGFQLGLLQPAPAWMAISGLALITTLGTLVGAGSILRLAFPAGAFLVGVFLYLRYPVLYISFTWWICFLTPFLRRVMDFRSGWDPQGVILTAPFLVMLISLATFVRYFPHCYRQGSLPFVLACIGIFYGYGIGIVLNPVVTATRALLDWLPPVIFAFHLFVHWRDYPKYRQNMQRTFTWCVLVTGIYGVVQYLVAPVWDCFWIIQTELTTNGTPEPLGIRVFSTMNSPGPYAEVMLAGLLLLFSSKNPLRLPASIAGYLAFLLTLVRSAWGGWFLGLLTLLASLKARLQMRLVITILLMGLCILPLTAIEPFSEILATRFETFSNLEDDTSLNDRTYNYGKNFNLAMSNLLGNGVGSIYTLNEKGVFEPVVLDSGILDSFFTLGWLGAIPYLGGMLLAMFELFQGAESRADSFLGAARAISIGIISQMIFSSVMLGLSGLVFWSFLAMGLAGQKYYRQQRFSKT